MCCADPAAAPSGNNRLAPYWCTFDWLWFPFIRPFGFVIIVGVYWCGFPLKSKVTLFMNVRGTCLYRGFYCEYTTTIPNIIHFLYESTSKWKVLTYVGRKIVKSISSLSYIHHFSEWSFIARDANNALT